MAKMGYVVGTGLGKRGEGRVEPVAAVVLPPGKSLGIYTTCNIFPYVSPINILRFIRSLYETPRSCWW